jgi:hypothetical protein
MVFGTVRDNGQARMNFTIDNGGTSGSFDVPELTRSGPTHNKLFWASPALEGAAHTLSIIVDQDSNLDNQQTLFLDYFVYTTTSTGRKSVLVDDSDIRVTYSQDWDFQNDSDASLERTQHVSTSDGSWVSLTFEGSHSYLLLFKCDSQSYRDSDFTYWDGVRRIRHHRRISVDGGTTISGFYCPL